MIRIKHYITLLSQPAWAAWIEIKTNPKGLKQIVSQPAWAAWIEIRKKHSVLMNCWVAACMGCVD